MKGRKRECKKVGMICMINRILFDFVLVGLYIYLINCLFNWIKENVYVVFYFSLL